MTTWAEEKELSCDAWRLKLRMDKVLFHETSEHQSIVLFENPLYGRVLMIDGIVQTTERDEFYYHEMLTHLPVFTHGAVSSVLIIGGGDGGALEELLKHSSIEKVTMVEIDQAVVDFSKAHMPEVCGQAFDDTRLELVIADGVEWVEKSADRFDLILIDATDAVDQGGPGEVLYTEAFYRSCGALLNPGGLLVTQNAVPFFEPNALARPYKELSRAFAGVAPYRVAVPSFYGGDMVFCMAAEIDERLNVELSVLHMRYEQSGLKTRYYSPEIHRGALALPPCITDLLSG